MLFESQYAKVVREYGELYNYLQKYNLTTLDQGSKEYAKIKLLLREVLINAENLLNHNADLKDGHINMLTSIINFCTKVKNNNKINFKMA